MSSVDTWYMGCFEEHLLSLFLCWGPIMCEIYRSSTGATYRGKPAGSALIFGTLAAVRPQLHSAQVPGTLGFLAVRHAQPANGMYPFTVGEQQKWNLQKKLFFVLCFFFCL